MAATLTLSGKITSSQYCTLSLKLDKKTTSDVLPQLDDWIKGSQFSSPVKAGIVKLKISKFTSGRHLAKVNAKVSILCKASFYKYSSQPNFAKKNIVNVGMTLQPILITPIA